MKTSPTENREETSARGMLKRYRSAEIAMEMAHNRVVAERQKERP